MIHNPIESSADAHWGVSLVSIDQDAILLQIQDQYGQQARIRITSEEALEIANALHHNIQDIWEYN